MVSGDRVVRQGMALGSAGWLLTMGDLLTLLLCFFVVGLSHDLRPSPSQSNGLDQSGQRAGMLGTDLAQLTVAAQGESAIVRAEGGQSVPHLEYSQADFDAALKLNPEKFQELLALFRSLPKGRSLIVSACSWSKATAGGQFERALLRQFVDGGIRVTRIRFALPRECSENTVLTVTHG